MFIYVLFQLLSKILYLLNKLQTFFNFVIKQMSYESNNS